MDAKSRIRMSIYNIYSSIVPIKINIHVYDIITFLILYYCCALLLYRRYRIILPHTNTQQNCEPRNAQNRDDGEGL